MKVTPDDCRNGDLTLFAEVTKQHRLSWSIKKQALNIHNKQTNMELVSFWITTKLDLF